MMVSQDLGSAIDNYVGVFRCEPQEQAKSQLRQLIQEQGNPSNPPSTADSRTLEVLRQANRDLDAKANRLSKTITSLTSEADALIKGNEKLKERAEKAERDLADERTQREMHEGNMEVVIEKLGGKTSKHNFLQRIDELIEKEKEHFKPKAKKKN